MTEQSQQRKRRRDVSIDQDSELVHAWLDEPNLDDDFWTNHSFYAVAEASNTAGLSAQPSYGQQGDDDLYLKSANHHVEGTEADLYDSNVIADLFPSLLPSVPSPAGRAPDIAVSNPFQADGMLEHPRLRSEAKPVEVPVDGVINGLIKFRLRQNKEPEPVEMRRPQFLQRHMKSRRPNPTTAQRVPYLPPEFGRGLRLDSMDLKLMQFYVSAFCPGRTLLPMTNTWLGDVAAMAEKSECVKHALLSLAASYVLDYMPAENLKARATLHHRRAVTLLDSELAKAGTYQPGGGEEAVCTLAILNQEDVSISGLAFVTTRPAAHGLSFQRLPSE
ncbi:MAG: hypothetical protein Q9198_000725 [Flavoplaca austrocitrina]